MAPTRSRKTRSIGRPRSSPPIRKPTWSSRTRTGSMPPAGGGTRGSSPTGTPCLESLLTRTHYSPFEILLLVNERHRGEPEKRALIERFAADPRLRVLAYPDRPFNYSWVNNWGAAQAAGELLCFLNDDTSVIT